MVRRPGATRTAYDPATSDTVVTIGWWALSVWLWPWAAAVALLPLAGLLRILWGGSRGPAAVVGLCVAGLVALTWRAGRARAAIVRAHAAATVAACGGWLVTASVTGPGTRPVFDAWVLLFLAGGVSWNVRHALRGNGLDGANGWSELAEAVRLPGSRVTRPVREGHRVSATVEVAKGEQTAADVAASRERIASGLGVAATGVRVEPDPDNAARARLTVVTFDVLRTPQPWPGPSAPGGSIADPLVLGIRETGEPLRLWLPGDHRAGRSATHVLVTGMTGSGKSAAARLLLAEVLTRRDAEVLLVDAVKGSQFVTPFADRVARLATSVEQARELVAELPAVITRRADQLGRAGYDQWAPGCGLPYVVVLVEEAASVVATSRPFVQAAQTGRSAGVSLVVSLQRAVHTNLPTDVRQQMGAALAFGCRPGDERYSGLSGATLDAGAAPQSWGASRPGYVYAELPGTEAEQWSTPARTYLSDAVDIAAACGASHPTGPGEILAVRRAQPAGPTPPAAARALLRDRIDQLAADGRDTIRPSDLADVRVAVGRSPAWLSGELRRLVDAGALVERERGVYGCASASSDGVFTSRARAH